MSSPVMLSHLISALTVRLKSTWIGRDGVTPSESQTEDRHQVRKEYASESDKQSASAQWLYITVPYLPCE
jgi:hypothetical protein